MRQQTGTQAKQAGMKKAIDHADEVYENWSEMAYRLLRWYVTHMKKGATFMTEDFRSTIKGLVPEPPSNRAYGRVIYRAACAGLIKRVGYGQVKNVKAHRANATIWTKY